MTLPWGYWIALLAPLCGLVYLWMKYRALSATATELSTHLEQRNTELLEAHESLSRSAGIDTLTSLANHSAFQEFLQAEWRRALRDASCISMMMVGVDRFSEYNDRLGHQTGDECLAKIGSTLKEMVGRPGDLVARYGGRGVRGRDVTDRPAGRIPRRASNLRGGRNAGHGAPGLRRLVVCDSQRGGLHLHPGHRFELGRARTGRWGEQSPYAGEKTGPEPDRRS